MFCKVKATNVCIDGVNVVWYFVTVVTLVLSGLLVEELKVDANALLSKNEKYEFYVQVVRSRFSFSNSTAVLINPGVASPDPSPPFAFGDAMVFDDKITECPDFFSKEIGRVKGVFFQVCHDHSAHCSKILVVAAFDFTAGRLTGTLPVTFLEDLTIPVRTYAFHGGTGDFLMAKGVGVVTPTVLADGYLRSYTVLHIKRHP